MAPCHLAGGSRGQEDVALSPVPGDDRSLTRQEDGETSPQARTARVLALSPIPGSWQTSLTGGGFPLGPHATEGFVWATDSTEPLLGEADPVPQ